MSRVQDFTQIRVKFLIPCFWILGILLSACLQQIQDPEASQLPALTTTPTISPRAVSERPIYTPGELVDYIAQSGDTLSNLSFRFNTTVEEILAENPIIPESATTLPPGLPMQIPIYYEALWGSQFQILPNCAFINGPAQIGFNVTEFVESQPGWLKNYQQYAAKQHRSGAEIVSYISSSFSISPRVLLALLEYQTGALSNPIPPDDLEDYPLGYVKTGYHGLYIQLVWAANSLNQGYYGWLVNHLDTLEYLDQTIQHPDPWQNAATVALQYYFSRLEPREVHDHTISSDGFLKTYQSYFEDPWSCEPHIPGSLRQPTLRLPFKSGKTWAFTGGPHTDLHLGTQHKAREGVLVEAGDLLGHPSCEGGESTGSHIHIARKYNGEWIPASGTIPFNLDGWIAHDGAAAYLGTLTRFTETVIASVEAEEKSLLSARKIIP